MCVCAAFANSVREPFANTFVRRSFAVAGGGVRWTKSCQGTNFLVSYTKKDTNDSALGGRDEALELAAHNYGRDEWWLLLDPVSG